ncbi:MAG: ATP-binding cassette domain-containing protein [Candidatus Omnitrophica bacterium]|nr:ATP-binding cassette domain-containing protein [Candidatus Omnitrophota bacterium]MDE2221500.1 ATP-binding cassette domain-containing protein [Candidatus Omnitrophota bacterium]
MINLRLKRQMQTSRGPEWIDLDLSMASGGFVSLFGKSGAGKTTVLRMLAGLIPPQEGRIEVDGDVWFDSGRKINKPIQQRKVGFVFQDNCLFPHMTVRENLAYACLPGHHDGIQEWIGLMGLSGLEGRKPHQLSGGQKQRAALARALVGRPRMLLLDEPFSNLDRQARLELQDEIMRVYRKTRITMVLVSHDLWETFRMSEMIFVIDRGRITKNGSPDEVFVNNDLSGKFQFTGEVLDICKEGVVNILTLGIGHQITKVVAGDEEISDLKVGSMVIVAAKAFNPLLFKI